MRGDEGVDDAEQLLLGLGRHALDLLDAAFQARADAGQLAGLSKARSSSVVTLSACASAMSMLAGGCSDSPS